MVDLSFISNWSIVPEKEDCWQTFSFWVFLKTLSQNIGRPNSIFPNRFLEHSGKNKGTYFPSHIVFSRCEEKLSKYNLLFFEGFEIPKMAAEVLFEVKAVGRDLGMVRGCHFSNRKTREKANYTRIIFWTLRKNNEWRRVLFQIFWFFPMKIKIIVKKFVQVLTKLSKCEEICPSVLKKTFPHTRTNQWLW